MWSSDGGSEADRLKVVVQLQEAALQRLSLKSQQLEDTLDMYTSQQGDIEDRVILLFVVVLSISFCHV